MRGLRHLRLVGRHDAGLGGDGGLLGGKLLGRDGVLRRQRLVAAQVDPGIGQGGAVAGQLALGLGQRRLIGARIDLGQQLALLHRRADIDIPFLHIAADLGIDRRAGEGLHIARQGRGCRRSWLALSLIICTVGTAWSSVQVAALLARSTAASRCPAPRSTTAAITAPAGPSASGRAAWCGAASPAGAGIDAARRRDSCQA